MRLVLLVVYTRTTVDCTEKINFAQPIFVK